MGNVKEIKWLKIRLVPSNITQHGIFQTVIPLKIAYHHLTLDM